MVFPSLPIYLDPPNWSQQQPNQESGIGTQNNIPPPQSPSLTAAGEGGGSGYQSSIRPGSMADRARLSKIHQPDATLKCPRCESTNTKFCYYNNYNLSQPRHFCKTCRRYWTKGGALRNVPVGGGCRRNKRTKATSKSPMKLSDHRQAEAAAANSISASAKSSNGCTTTTTTTDLNLMMPHLPPPTQLPFLASLHHYNGDFSSHFGTTPTALVARNGNNVNTTSNVGSDIAEFQIGTSSSSSSSVLLSSGIGEQWRLSNLQQVHHQQFPFLTNLEPQIGLFQFGGDNNNNNNGEPTPSYSRDGGGRLFNRSNKAMDSSGVNGIMMPQVNTIKMEENQGLSLPKNLLSGSAGNDLFWNGSGNAWSEVPSFIPSPRNLL